MVRRTSSLLAVAGLCVLAGSSFNPAAAGPDVIVGDLPNLQYFGQVNGIAAYSIATTSCNIGNAQLLWIENNSQHPVIAQNLYRIKGGRFEQIGQSWLKHGFCALQGTVCSSTPGYPACVPAGGGCVSRLGVGCSDPYSSSLNGTQSRLGPRSHVSPWTGQFPYPFTSPGAGYTAPLPAAATIGRRLQVPIVDVTPAQNPGAIYLMEGQYVTADDSLNGTQNNNASYRRINFASPSSFSNSGGTQRQKPAIQGWKDLDPTVSLQMVDVPGEGRFYVGAKVVDNGDGTWTYNYAVFNMNSAMAGGSFSVPLACGATATNTTFHHPESHSGEPYSNADWAVTIGSGNAVAWATETESANTNANAIRWGTTYSFSFTAGSAPTTGTVSVGLFKTDAGSLAVADMPVPAGACRANWNEDAGVNSSDISAYLTSWLASLTDGDNIADYNCDSTVNSSDISAYITSWLAALSGGC